MTHLILPGGTDVAEMALFASDSLPDETPGNDMVSRLETMGVLLRFPTGSDGSYLLHAYVSEPIPDDVLNYCDREDPITGAIDLPGGKLAFGGIESACRNYKPNPNIRSDAEISPGQYSVIAYKTDIPDEIFEHARSYALTSKERRILAIPSIVFPITLITIVTLCGFRHFGPAGVILGALFAWWHWFKKSSTYRSLLEKDKTVQLQFPSIVIALTLRS